MSGIVKMYVRLTPDMLNELKTTLNILRLNLIII